VIVQLSGSVLESNLGRLVLDVNGVGYEVITPSRQFSKVSVGDNVTVITSFVVREDSQTLYGFESHEAKQLFMSLHSVTGVGPKSALAVLSHWDSDTIANAIAHGDDKVFSAVSGIGPKTAKLICVTLAGKVSLAAAGTSAELQSVISALISFGWSDAIATKTVKTIAAESPTMSAGEILKAALASNSSAKVAD
jgi:Holliday junction DNA helicase RuvA